MGKYATLGQIASLLKVDARTVNRWSDPTDRIHIKGFGKVEHGKYDIVKCVHARVDDYERMLNEAQSSVKDAKEQNLLLDARKKQIELAEVEKEILRVNDVIGFLEQIIPAYKNKFPASRKVLGLKVLAAKDDKEVIKLLEERDNELLNAFATTITNIVGSLAESASQVGDSAQITKPARNRKSK